MTVRIESLSNIHDGAFLLKPLKLLTNLKGVKYFCKKTSSKMFRRVLNTHLLCIINKNFPNFSKKILDT